MTTPSPHTQPAPNPRPISNAIGKDCAHWFYWISPMLIAYCQDCPHFWSLSRPHSADRIGHRSAESRAAAQRPCRGPGDGEGARR